MSRKSLGVLALTLAFSTTLMAQSEPFLGIWEIDLERTSNYPMQTQMIINVSAPNGGFISTRAQIRENNESSSMEVHPVFFDGQPHQTTGGDPRPISYRLTDPLTIERTHNREGRISTDTERVTADGKTMIVTQENRVRYYNKKFDVSEIGQ